MSLSKRENSTSGSSVTFDPSSLGEALQRECPELDFVLLLGSGQEGRIPAGGDIDLAVGMKGRLTWAMRERISGILGRYTPGVAVDLGHFDSADPCTVFKPLRDVCCSAMTWKDTCQRFPWPAASMNSR